MKNLRPLKIVVVLVRTLYDRNIGSTSRAMANMGVQELVLINPQCEITYEAQLAAATGQEALQNRKVYPSMSEFLKNEPDGLRLAFTARDGRGRATRDLLIVLEQLVNNSPYFEENQLTPLPLYMIFGPEDAGLATDEIQDAHYCCSLPTYGTNSSLNLSQAVLLGLYILRQLVGGDKTKLDGQQVPRSEQVLPKNFLPDLSLKHWLEALGVDISSKKINAYTVLKRMFLQNTPTLKEYQMFETMVQQTVRKLNKLKEMESKNFNTEARVSKLEFK